MMSDEKKTELLKKVALFTESLKRHGSDWRSACAECGIPHTTGYRWFMEGIKLLGVAPLSGRMASAERKGRVRRIASSETGARLAAGGGVTGHAEVAQKRFQSVVAERESEAAVVSRELQVRDEEGKMVALSRGATIQSSASTLRLTVVGQRMLDEVEKKATIETAILARWNRYWEAKLRGDVVAVKPFDKRPELGLSDSIKTLGEIALLVRRNTSAVNTILEAERRFIGAPTEVIGLAAVPTRMTNAEARERLRYMQALLEHNEALEASGIDGEQLKVPVIGEPVED